MAKAETQPDVDGGGNAAPVARAQLRQMIARIEKVNEELSALQEDRNEIFAEAKAFGLDPKIMRILIRRRAMDTAKRQEQDALVHVYSVATGTPSPADAD